MKHAKLLGVFMIALMTLSGCAGDSNPFPERKSAEYVQQELAKLAPVELSADISNLSKADLKALDKLLQASKIIDELFLLQVDPENPEIRADLVNADLPHHHELFEVMFGKWNRLEEDEPFLDNDEKPAGAGFYPPDLTKDEFETWLQNHPDDEDAFTSEFTVIRRRGDELIAIPYHEAYSPLVQKVAELLREAAQLTDDPTLSEFLKLRAAALLSDDYFDSDMAWMDLSGDLEIVISPYEVYEDQLFNYKAAYEAFLCAVDHEESKKLETVAQYLNDMERHLPIPEEHKNYDRGSSSPIKVVQELYAAGDTKAGIQTTAFNLPNDERVREAKGSKKVMLKNVARAKFDKCWIPIVNTILAEEPLSKVSFDAYFNHVLMHEMAHGIGPGIITKNGEETTVAKELKELYSSIEECKADVLGIYNVEFMVRKGVFGDDIAESMYPSYLGGMFRSIRFGIDAAHGGGVAIQFNFFMEKGAFFINQNGKLDYDPELLYDAIVELAEKVLMIEAEGDYDAAKALMDEYSKMTPEMENYIDMLKDVPIDIRPSFTLEQQLTEILAQ